MLLVFCFVVIFVCSFYAHKYVKRTTEPRDLRNINISLTHQKNLINKSKMSDNEFQEPWKANGRWKQKEDNKVLTPNKGGLFRWKRKLASEAPDVEVQNDEKRQKAGVLKKKQTSMHEVIELTDDESETSVSDNDQKLKVIESPIKHQPKYNNVPLPPGMPPVIAGVPVKFPVTPYKSQISVMNAVIKGCKHREHCLLESPTGSGKTLALLCAALAWQTSFKETQINESHATPKNTEKVDLCRSIASQSDVFEGQLQVEVEEVTKDIKEKAIKNVKIFYGSRTHKQIDQVIRELRKTAYADKLMTILSSREITCIQDVQKGISKTQLCNDLRDPTKKKSCIYYNEKIKYKMSTHNNLENLGLETPWDIEDLIDLGKQHSACPYFAARSLMENAEIIFCPYNYLIDPFIRESMKINLEDTVVIIDEAHNVEDICRDIGSYDFREDHLAEAAEDCKLVFGLTKDNSYSILEKCFATIMKVINEQLLPETANLNEETTGNSWSGDEIWILFKMNGFDIDMYEKFREASKQAIRDYEEVIEDIQNRKNLDDQKTKNEKKKKAITFATIKLIQSMTKALEYINHSDYCKDYRCTISMAFHYDAKVKIEENTWISGQGGRRLRSLRFICMNPAVIFKPIAKLSRCLILASGTLSPTSTFESELGIKFTHKLHANHVVSKEQVYVRGIARGPKGTVLRATYKNVQMLPFKDDLGGLIMQVCQTVPHGVLCFFSSYTMMTSQIDRWSETGLWYELQRYKHVFTEPRSSTNIDETMRQYRDAVRDTESSSHGITGALLLAVFRGKVSEGIDFSDNEARCVIAVGIPFPGQNDACVKLKREYNDRNRSKGLLSGGEWYTIQAYRALNQALGRCIRHRNDWGAILLVDERLLMSSCMNYLPKWIREMRLEGSNYNLKEELNDFVERQRIRDKERAIK